MIEKPYTGRVKIYRNGDTIEITVPSRKRWFWIIFLTAWLGFWVMGESSTLQEVFDENTDTTVRYFLIFWLVGWTLGGLAVIYNLLWFMAGEEIITVNTEVLKLGKQIFGLGPVKSYQIADIKQMTVIPTGDKDLWENISEHRLIRSGLIQFDYGLKTIKFGGEFDLAEARQLVEIFKRSNNFTAANFE